MGELAYMNMVILSLIIYKYVLVFNSRQARFACLRCAAGGHFVSAGGSLRSPGGDIG